jgi:AmmeMemoRadiSam system protein B
MPSIASVRPSPIAGSWYARDSDRLRESIESYLHNAILPEIQGKVIGLVAPHAGHIYSGATAGYAFKTVESKSFDRVVVLSPFHDFHFAPLLTTAHDAYQTPLGKMEVDRTTLDEIENDLTKSALSLTPIAHDREHSLEIELPFLQVALKSPFLLVPIMVRTQQPDQVHALASALAHSLEGKSALLVASSDLSHFYPEKTAETFDEEMMKQIEAFSPEGVFKTEKEGKGFACGLSAITAVLWTAEELGANRVKLLHHSTSADQTGDRSSVVGYGAAVILKT